MAIRFDTWTSTHEFEEKALQEESDCFRLSGLAGTYKKDKVNDVIIPGAFKQCLDRMAQKGEALQLYFNHRVEEPPIGSIELVEERKLGLYYEATLPKDDEFVAKRIIPQIKRRSLRSNSFGYKAREVERRKDDGGRNLKRIDIFEISVVNSPCGEGTDILGVKGLVPFADLKIDRDTKTWDAQAAFKRLREHFKDDACEIKQAFLYVDPDKSVGEWDTRFLIGDVDENGCVKAANHALLRIPACLYGSRQGDCLPEEVDEAVKSILDRYYQRLDLESPAKSLTVSEWTVLDAGEREARLRGFGVSQRLAKQLVFGQRDADRSSGERDVRPVDDALKLITAALVEAASAIKR